MNDYLGIIFAYSASPELGELVRARTAASLPFCGRYRMIDFALSSMRNAGIFNVGVIMQRDYQSLLDHIGSGKAWDMSRKAGGLKMLPPFGLPEFHKGNYTGTIEALNAVASSIKDAKQQHVVLMLGNLCANIDLNAAIECHRQSGAGITAICADHTPDGCRIRYTLDAQERVDALRFDESSVCDEGLASLECYVADKSVLLELMDTCRAQNLYRFHKDAIMLYLSQGGTMAAYVHPGYASIVRTVDAYYKANMDMLEAANRSQLFPAARPVLTKNHEGVSTYYSENARACHCLVADNCIIEGDMENCIIFSGARIGRGARLRDCIVMRGGVIGERAELSHVIADKEVRLAAGTVLTGSPKLPFVIPKRRHI